MSKISEFEPKNVFRFFEEISQIPHGSGNTEKLAAYCLGFAAERGLKSFKDSAGNIVIYKPGTKGYEKSEPIILQGHLDMVCEKVKGCKIDMSHEGLKLCHDEKYIWADGTTLGADDGIAVAYMLALLDSSGIPHPPIEAMFTNDEEIGLIGAHEFDMSVLKGKKLINIDSETEGILTVSCAGGVRAYAELSLDFVQSNQSEIAFEVEISGLLGGHSGVDINSQRKNAHILMGRILQHIARTIEFGISAIDGGKRTNVIPNSATAIVCIDSADEENFTASVNTFDEIIREELQFCEPGVKITAAKCDLPEEHTDGEGTRKVIFTLQQIPNGIQAMSPDVPNMVQTSLNMGELSMQDHKLKMGFLIRSNASTGKQLTIQKLQSFIDYLYGTIEFAADYPAWEYRADSPLRDIMVSSYEKVYADKPEIASIHAGLECGILSGKSADLDMVSVGPDLENVHTPNERMSIASAGRCWKHLLKTLEMLK